MSPKYGDYAKCYPIGQFLTKNKEDVIDDLKSGLEDLYGKVEDGVIRAWNDTYDVLLNAMAVFPDCYWDLDIIFEYVIPKNKPGTNLFNTGTHRRAGVIILSSQKVLVLTFKRTDATDEASLQMHVNKAGMYARRLKDFHDESYNMQVQPILVLTKAEQLLAMAEMGDNNVVICSPDKLARVILRFFGDYPKKYYGVRDWLNSKFSSKE